MYRAVDDGDQHCGVACGDDCGGNCASGRSGSDRIDEHLGEHIRGLHVREWTLAHGHRYRLHHRSSLLSAPSSSGIYIFIPSCLPAHHLLSSFLQLVALTENLLRERNPWRKESCKLCSGLQPFCSSSSMPYFLDCYRNCKGFPPRFFQT